MGAIAWKGSRVQTQLPQDGRCRHMAQSRPASTESVPVDQMLMPWPKRPCPCSLLPASTSPRALFNCHGRCKTRANHHRQRPLCITQPRQDRRVAYATTSLRGLFLTLEALSLCRLGHGRREWPEGLNCRHLSSSRCQPARWLVSCCFLVFLAPSVSSPASSLRDAPMKPAGGGSILSGPLTSTISFCKAPYPPPALFLDHVAVVPRSWTSHLDQMADPREPLFVVRPAQQGRRGDHRGQCLSSQPTMPWHFGSPCHRPGAGPHNRRGKSSPWTHVPCDPARLFCALAGAPA